MKTCVTCSAEDPPCGFYPNRTANGGGNVCRACKRVRDKRHREANRAAVRLASRDWHKRNRDRVRAKSAAARRELRIAVIAAYGGACACCGEARLDFLTLDHIDGGGSAHRRRVRNKVYADVRRRGYPPGYRVLCWNCNCAIGLYGRCPHESETA